MHARTLLVSDGDDDLVVRGFPPGDQAVRNELRVLPRLGPLAGSAPRLLAGGDDPDHGPVIVTTRVPGSHPAAWLDLATIAREMAAALARIHWLTGEGLTEDPAVSAYGGVLTHGDFWSGNALWEGDRVTGVVDWSGACYAPRGIDVAWCRQDLVLLGSPGAAEVFLGRYESATGRRVGDVLAWDVRAADRARDHVEDRAARYAATGREDVSGEVLRRRFDAWDTWLGL